MSSIGTAYVEVKPDFDGFGKKVKKGMGPGLKIASAAIAGGLAVAFKGAFEEAREAQKVGKQTAAVIKSTGGAAKMSAKEIGNLANSLSLKSGIDDEAIQSGENLLLTFTKVRDEAGKGNDIFTQGTKIALDMSVALGQDMKSSVVQVGKALNNPIKGVTALQRVGVAFTAQQRDQIKALVESGRTLDAQKLILRELNTEFKGSAAAQADPFDRFNVAVKDLQESVGTVLLPVMADAATALSDFIDQMQVGRGFGGALVKRVKTVFDRIKAVIESGIGGFKGKPDYFSTIMGDPRTMGQKLSDGLAAALATADLSGVVRSGLEGLRANTPMIAETLLEVVIATLNTAMDPKFLADHIVELIGLALTFSKVGFLRKIPILGPMLGKAGDFIWDTGRVIFGRAFKGLAAVSMRGIMSGLAKLPVSVGVFLVATVNKIKSLAGRFAAGGTTLGERAGNAIYNGLRSLGGAMLSAGKWLMGKAWDGIKWAFSRLFSAGRGAGDRVRDGVASLWKKFWDVGKFLMGKLKDGLIKAPLNGLAALGRRIGNAIQGGIGKLKATVGIGGGLPVGAMGHGKGNMGSVAMLAASFGNMVTSGYRPGDDGWHGKNRARDFAGGNMMGFAKAVASRFGSGLLELIHTPLGWGIKNGRKVPASFFGPAVMADHYDHVHVAMARGGILGGTGLRDTIPVMAAPGEAILTRHQQAPVNAAMLSTFGVGLDSVFANRKPHYASTGMASSKKPSKKQIAKSKRAAAKKVAKYQSTAEMQDAKAFADGPEGYEVDLKKRLKAIDALLKKKYISRSDRIALLNARGQVVDEMAAADVTTEGDDPAVAAQQALAEAVAAQAQALADNTDALNENRAFAQKMHTATKSVTDTTMQAILDRILGGQLSTALLTLAPKASYA